MILRSSRRITSKQHVPIDIVENLFIRPLCYICISNPEKSHCQVYLALFARLCSLYAMKMLCLYHLLLLLSGIPSSPLLCSQTT